MSTPALLRVVRTAHRLALGTSASLPLSASRQPSYGVTRIFQGSCYLVRSLHVTPIAQDSRSLTAGAPLKQLRRDHGDKKPFASSSGMIVDPYPVATVAASSAFALSPQGIKKGYAKLRSMLRTAFAVNRIKKKEKNFSRERFVAEACNTYELVNAALAAGDLSELRSLVTEKMYTELKKGVKSRAAGEVHRWEVKDFDMSKGDQGTAFLQARVMIADPKRPDFLQFAQVTVRIVAEEAVAVMNRQGKLLRGSLEKTSRRTSHWVLERNLTSPASRWRLAAKL